MDAGSTGIVEAVDEREQAHSDLVAIASHEMRRPLTAILGFSQTLRTQWQELPDALREELLGRVEHSARAMMVMLDQILDLARLELGQYSLDLRPVEVAELMARVRENMNVQLAGHEVRVVCPQEALVLTEPGVFERILGNLLGNAAKFSAAGTPIDVEVEVADADIEISVSDRCPGIPEEERPKVFERFYQARRDAGGTGLGLAVVRDLVGLHGGGVELNGRPGSGCCFTVRLPRPV